MLFLFESYVKQRMAELRAIVGTPPTPLLTTDATDKVAAAQPLLARHKQRIAMAAAAQQQQLQ